PATVSWWILLYRQCKTGCAAADQLRAADGGESACAPACRDAVRRHCAGAHVSGCVGAVEGVVASDPPAPMGKECADLPAGAAGTCARRGIADGRMHGVFELRLGGLGNVYRE